MTWWSCSIFRATTRYKCSALRVLQTVFWKCFYPGQTTKCDSEYFFSNQEQTGLSSYLNLENRPLVVPVFEADFLSTVFEGRNLCAVVKSRGELLCYVHGEIPSHISSIFFLPFFRKNICRVSG